MTASNSRSVAESEPLYVGLSCWAQLRLPARIDPPTCAKLLGFADHDIPILVAEGLLHPLGKPTPSAPKWFSAIEIVNLAADPDWLGKATQKLSAYWRSKRQRGLTKRANAIN